MEEEDPLSKEKDAKPGESENQLASTSSEPASSEIRLDLGGASEEESSDQRPKWASTNEVRHVSKSARELPRLRATILPQAVRDLHRCMETGIRTKSRLSASVAQLDPNKYRLYPEVGTASDVAKPGGFRYTSATLLARGHFTANATPTPALGAPMSGRRSLKILREVHTQRSHSSNT